MDAVGTAGECHVQSIVHDEPRPRSVGNRAQIPHDGRQDRGFEIALANLDNVDAGIDSETRLRLETPARVIERRRFAGEAPSIGDEANRHERGVPSGSDISRGSRE